MSTCPHCHADMTGNPIPEEHRHHYGGKTHWSRVLVHTVNDRTAAYQCPDCSEQWPPDKNKTYNLTNNQ